jgi:uncharacterized membrane protein YkvA (DUF1232 family)
MVSSRRSGIGLSRWQGARRGIEAAPAAPNILGMSSLAPSDLWDKVRRHLPRLPFIEDLLAAYYCAMDPKTPKAAKAILIGALAYFVAPIDLIPDFLAVVGFTDDAAVIAAAIAAVRQYMTTAHYDEAQKTLDRLAS